jgi:hypothetical protein
MKARATASAKIRDVRDIAAEMEHLFRRQIELLKSGTFVSLKPSRLTEFDRIGVRIRTLFQELQDLRQSSGDSG